MLAKDLIDRFRVEPGKKFKLKNHDPSWAGTAEMKELGKEVIKERAREVLNQSLADLSTAQELLYADDRYSILIVLQAMDSAGKDGTIKHVMSGVNPQGCEVYSFKKPTPVELDHTFLWRYMRCLPERGRIGIFNRSYYEDVLVVKVHPELLGHLMPQKKNSKKFWERRYEDIKGLERHLVRNGTIILKFFLNVSKDEQKKRFLERLDRPEKNWKFSSADIVERGFWDDYQAVYEEAINETSTKFAPWYVIPADHKWVTRCIIADIIATTITSLDIHFPEMSEEHLAELATAREKLMSES